MSGRTRHLPLLLLAVASAVFAAEPPERDWNDVRSLFAVGRFGAARELAVALAEQDDADAHSLYWLYRLAESPAEAADLRNRLLAADGLGTDARDLLNTDAAWSSFGDGDYEATIDALSLIDAGDDETAASTTLLGGLAWRARGDVARSRDALAAVPTTDPDYDRARYLLARLALADGEPALARRYLEMAGRTEDSVCRAELLLADWMLAVETDPQQSVRLRRELEHRFSRSLPAALVAEQESRLAELQRDLETSDRPEADDPTRTEADRPASAGGRYTLQFAAFADRGRALDFLDDWRGRLSGLAIREVADDRGHVLYKLQAGAFAGMSQAREAAADLRERHDLEALPIKVDDSP